MVVYEDRGRKWKGKVVALCIRSANLSSLQHVAIDHVGDFHALNTLTMSSNAVWFSVFW
jgi:hypothetical protein